MDAWIWLSLAVFVGALLVVITLYRGFSSSKVKNTANPKAAARPGGQRAEIAGGMRRRNVRNRVANLQRERERARQAAAMLQEDSAEEIDRDSDDVNTIQNGEEEDEGLKAFSGKKVGTKKLKRLQEKAEKKAMREQEEAMREDRKRREALKEEERKRELEEEKIQEAKEEEERQRLKEEQERKEHEEYLKLKEAFVVEEEGEASEEDEEMKSVREFVDHIKRHKVVYMEDLAAEFNMKTQEAISRVHSLQESKELSGVVDDRGKFIYISEEELQAVANFIKQRGRVSIAELVSSSNRLINLEPEQSTVTT